MGSKVYGLTGGFGTGKSTVAKMFEGLGAKIIDADQVSPESTEPGQPGWTKIRELLGDQYFTESGELDRKRLGRGVFSDDKLRHQLEEMTHPLIRDAIQKKVNAL